MSLDDAPIFQGLAEEELAYLRDKVSLRRFKPGEELLEFGQAAPGLYVIESGLVSAMGVGESGQEQELATLGKGECVGEMALLTGEPCSATVRAVSETEAWLLAAEEFAELVQRYPGMWRNLGRILSQRLVRANRHLQARQYANTVALVIGAGDEEAAALAVAVAGALARQSGRRTLLVDARGRSSCPVSRLAPGEVYPSLRSILSDRSLLKRHEAAVERSDPLGGARIASLFDEGHEAPGEDEQLTALELATPLYEFTVILTRGEGGGVSPVLLQRTRSLMAVVTEPGTGGAPPWLDGLIEQAAARGKVDVAMFTGAGGDAPLLLEAIEERLEKAVIRLPVGTAEVRRLAREAGTAIDGGGGPALRKSVERLARAIGSMEVGVALGAGGAKGFAHLGVLKVFEQQGFPIDYVAGCSIGAIVGALYAGGFSLEEIEGRIRGADRKFRRWTLPLRSIWSDAGLKELLQQDAMNVRFRDLQTPLAVVSTDIATGREIVTRKGLVWKAVQASVSVPGIFPPVLALGRALVDGGLVNPVPSQTARDLGADIVVAVDLMSRAARAPAAETASGGSGSMARIPNLVEILWRSTEIMQEEVTLRSAATADITIEPRIGRVRWNDFSRRGQSFMARGEQAAMEKLPELQRLLPATTTGPR